MGCAVDCRLFCCLVALGLGAACGSSGSGASRVNPTYVEIDPAEFTSEVPCSTSGGRLRWYVATLIDVTPDDEGRPLGFRLPSSPPAPCSQSVYFAGVVAAGLTHPGHQYVAEIEGYAEATLRPKHEGSRVMMSGGRSIEPQWIGSCGGHSNGLSPLLGVDAGGPNAADAGPPTYGGGPVTPMTGRTVRIRGCELDALGTGEGATQVSIDISGALGSLECGDDLGQVTRFEVEFDGEVMRAPCGGTVVFRNVPTETFLEFGVTAFTRAASDAGAGSDEAAWGTTCYQEAAAGRQLSARCDPLVPVE